MTPGSIAMAGLGLVLIAAALLLQRLRDRILDWERPAE